MKYLKNVSLIFIFFIAISCKEKVAQVENETVFYNNNDFEKAIIQDSLRILKTKQIQSEIASLKSKGIFGKWKTNHKGYKTNIVLTKFNSDFEATINFIDSKSKPTINKLEIKGNKFLVKGSDAKEFYLINKDGNLELWDNQGLFTIGYNTYPSLEIKKKPKFELDKVLGMNLFTVTGIFSQSNPKTLEGTNNDYWIVYYLDLNTTFKVKKNTMDIKKAVSGRISNLK